MDQAATAVLLGVLTPQDLAPVFGCTPAHVEELFRTGALPGVKHGRHWRTQVDALRAALRDELLARWVSAREPIPNPPAQPEPKARTGRRKAHV